MYGSGRLKFEKKKKAKENHLSFQVRKGNRWLFFVGCLVEPGRGIYPGSNCLLNHITCCKKVEGITGRTEPAFKVDKSFFRYVSYWYKITMLTRTSWIG